MTKHTDTEPDCIYTSTPLDNSDGCLYKLCAAVNSAPVIVNIICGGVCSIISECFSYIGCGD